MAGKILTSTIPNKNSKMIYNYAEAKKTNNPNLDNWIHVIIKDIGYRTLRARLHVFAM